MTTMNRRRFFRTPLAPAAPRPTEDASATLLPFSGSGLTPYTGPWTAQEASHLLGRATFGASYPMIQEAVSLGLEGTVARLLADQPMPPPPITTNPQDGGAAVGETWVDKPYGGENLTISRVSRIRSLGAWITGQMLTEGMSARESMTLFWHNHFAINFSQEPKYSYRYLNTLRSQAFGNFRQLVKDITIDPLMLAFLNGNENTLEAPNENYARELLELFTIGKGEQVGPGDYSTYTEEDVIAMAKLLTGWRNYGGYSNTSGEFGSIFRPQRHDSGTVTLSHRFDNRQVASSGENTFADLVDLILEKEEVSRFMARKLYRWFVYYEISPETEANVIEPLAEIFRQHDYQIRPVLEALLSSEHFYDVLSQGPMIKHPMDFTMGLVRQLQIPLEGTVRGLEALYSAIGTAASEMGMFYFSMPSVAGWKAFYQEPLYYRSWINATTLPRRQELSQALLATRVNIRGYGEITFRLLDIVEQFPEPGSLWPMIDNWIVLLFPRPITEGQREFLKDVLLPGLPDTQWAVEWADYQSNPDDEAIAQALENKLRAMVLSMLEMPEYQLS